MLQPSITYCKFCGQQTPKDNKVFCSPICRQSFHDKRHEQELANGTIDHRQLKKLLIKKFGDKCMSPNCVWDYSKIHVPTEIEHIDGNSQNNTSNNCILLCPNCHSLTPTFRNKNKGNGRFKRRQRYQDGKSW